MRAKMLGTSAVVATMALLLSTLCSTPEAQAEAPPLSATLISPANGAFVPSGTPLTVTAGDPDGGSIDVSFHAAVRGTEPGPTPAAPFTFVTLPDTQGYVITPTYTDVLRAQLQWIVANRQQLNLAFVTGLGDIVDNDLSSLQWSRANDSMAILDQGQIPYAVLPGNHDFDLATGDFAGYDANFPVARFRDAAWNSPSAHYGGYFGQNEFGTDAADRQNMNNYSLFTAGGMDFILVNLELNPPDSVLEWADRVLDAHPDHRAIIATHSYVFTSGNLANQMLRTDVVGNSGAQLFTKLVAPNCNVFLVVNGHFSNGTEGEANRVDQNACGTPVYGVLTDFQGRPNGGDGWLRYYTFDPKNDTITATTYSPSRNEFETDANSSFTMAYDMATPAVELPEIGTVRVTAGQAASVPLPDLPTGSIVDWYAVTDDGTSETRSATWTVTVEEPESATTLAADTFTRTTTTGWGTADTGGAWSVNSTSKTSTTGTTGRIASNAGSTLTATLPSVSATDIDLTAQVAIDKIPNQWMGLSATPRQVGADSYSARLRIKPNQTILLELLRNTTVLASHPLSAITAAPGTPISIRVRVEGTSPTQISARAWASAATEPATWQVSLSDSTAALQTAGTIRLTSYVSSATTNGPIAVTWDNLTSTVPGGGAPPTNTPPSSLFTAVPQGLSVHVDGSASSDADGTVQAWAWTFGDGATGTGAMLDHIYATAGTYTVTLTVTDDDGATNATSKPVTVEEPESATTLAADTFTRTTTTGWGTADTGGAWSVNSTSKTSTTGTTGRIASNAGSTLTATLPSVSTTDIDLTAQVAIDRLPDRWLGLSASPRWVEANAYHARLRINPNQTAILELLRDSTVLASQPVSAITVAAGTSISIRVQSEGTSPTQIRARAWNTSGTEPAEWQLAATDNTTALQAPGGLRLTSYLSSSTANGPVAVTWDNLVATAIE